MPPTNIDEQILLHEHYIAQTLRAARTPKGKLVRGLQLLADWAEQAATPVLTWQPRPGQTTWIWSDLHLNHDNIIKYSQRPYRYVRLMNESLLAAWQRMVQPDDAILNGGDVSLHGRLGSERLRWHVESAPGARKVLVVGNHDIDRKDPASIDIAGHDTAVALIVIETDPPMIVTHVPLPTVPDGWINLYGHVHNNEPLRESPWINICVEYTDYRPVHLDSLETLAKAMLAGNTPSGNTTVQRIEALDLDHEAPRQPGDQ